MTRLTTIKCDKIYQISFALTKSAGVFSCGFNLKRFGHHNFADLALWNHTYSYITKETVIKNSNFQLKPLPQTLGLQLIQLAESRGAMMNNILRASKRTSQLNSVEKIFKTDVICHQHKDCFYHINFADLALWLKNIQLYHQRKCNKILTELLLDANTFGDSSEQECQYPVPVLLIYINTVPNTNVLKLAKITL